jgi:hypothetical protein
MPPIASIFFANGSKNRGLSTITFPGAKGLGLRVQGFESFHDMFHDMFMY